MGIILTTTDDYNSVRAYLGVDDQVLPDSAITGVTFLPVAEAVITKAVNKQAAAGTGVKNVSQIIALSDTDPDKVFLRAATAAYVAYLFTPSSPNAVNTSVTDGEQTIDLGGIGAQWIEQGQKALQQCAFYLSQLDNWPPVNTLNLVTSGPSSSGRDSNTVSGFFRAGR